MSSGTAVAVVVVVGTVVVVGCPVLGLTFGRKGRPVDGGVAVTGGTATATLVVGVAVEMAVDAVGAEAAGGVPGTE